MRPLDMLGRTCSMRTTPLYRPSTGPKVENGKSCEFSIEEERRTLHVAMTRAKDELDLIVPQRLFMFTRTDQGPIETAFEKDRCCRKHRGNVALMGSETESNAEDEHSIRKSRFLVSSVKVTSIKTWISCLLPARSRRPAAWWASSSASTLGTSDAL